MLVDEFTAMVSSMEIQRNARGGNVGQLTKECIYSLLPSVMSDSECHVSTSLQPQVHHPVQTLCGAWKLPELLGKLACKDSLRGIAMDKETDAKKFKDYICKVIE